MRNVPGSPLAALAFLGILGACGADLPGGAPASAVTLRDSAGVTIVENHDSLWTEGTRWSIAAEPELVIGSVDGSVPGTDWGRIDDVISVGERTVVHDSNTQELRIFGPDGRYEYALGGRGEGPTEFRIITRVDALAGSRFSVAEGNTGKVVVFDLDHPAAPEVWFTGNPDREDHFGGQFQGWADADSYLLRYRPRVNLLPEGAFELMTADWQRIERSDGTVTDLPPLPHYRAYNKPGPDLLGIVQPAPYISFDTQGQHLWYAFPEAWELIGVDLESGLIDLKVRRDFQLRPTPEYLLEELRDAQMEAARQAPADIRAMVRRDAEAMEYAPFRPAFRTLLVDPEGFLWVNEEMDLSVGPEMTYSETFRARSPSWTVLDPEGQWLGTVEAPEGLVLNEVGTDYILGVRRNELDVPFVERYPILKPQ